MRRDLIENAINQLDEEYKLEALELHNQPISETTGMSKNRIKKTFIAVAIAACLTLALGITAFATDFFGIRTRDPESKEKLTVDYTVFNGKDYDVQTFTYNDVTKYVMFDGPQSCNRVEFKTTSLPEDYMTMKECFGVDMGFGDPAKWGDFAQFYVRHNGEIDEAVNMVLYYTPMFGPDGFMFFQDDFSSVVTETVGEYDVLKMEGVLKFEGSSDDYAEAYYIMAHPDGYILVLSGRYIEDLELIDKGLEFRKTNKVIEYNPNEDHAFFMANGVG